MKKRILYIQHAPRVGGSVISLKELIIDAIAHEIDCYVVCVNHEVGDFYKNTGAKVIIAPVAVFNHNSALHYRLTPTHVFQVFKQCIKFFFTLFYFLKIVIRIRPQIVHLNSSTLIPYVPFFRLISTKPFVHIREYVVNGNWGLRKRVLRFIVNKFAEKVFYISEVESENLKTQKAKSLIVYNYIHTKDFAYNSNSIVSIENKFKLITLGGIYKIKGGDVLLEAFEYLDDRFVLEIAGSEDPRKDVYDLKEVEGEEYYNKIMSLLSNEKISKRVKFLGRINNPLDYLQHANALIFWTQSPHFPRPVFEGWLLNCHILYYNPNFRNTHISPETVNFVKGSATMELKDAIENLFSNQESFMYKVVNGNKIAHRCFTEQNFVSVFNSYQKVFNQFNFHS